MDTYVEVLVKRKKTAGGTVLKIVTAALAVILFLIGIGSVIWLILAAAMGVLSYYIYLQSDVEYEYLYVDRELCVDKIMAKSRRKRVQVFEMDKLEILAPGNSWHLDEYKRKNEKTLDYSSGEENGGQLIMYYNGGTKVILEKDDTLLKAFQTAAPRKVFMD